MRGGPSAEHDVSLKTGENVLKHLLEKYKGIDLILNKDGQLYADGNFSDIRRLHSSVDVVFNALHGYFGEDGKIQQMLDSFGISYTGSGALASALAMNKVLSREFFKKVGLKIPKAIIVKEGEPIEEAAHKIFRTMNPFWVVKPASGGSSIGINIARNFQDLIQAIKNAFVLDLPAGRQGSTVIVEEYIKGREATCGILENFRGQEHYALPVIEIIPPSQKNFFDYECKYDGSTREICPANFDIQTKREIENIARRAHQALGCADYSRADMIVSSRLSTSLGASGIYLLEVNTLPGLTSESLVPKSAKAVGCEFPQFLEHIIELALNKR